MNFDTAGNPELFDIMLRYLSKRFNVRRPKLAISNTGANRGTYSNGRVRFRIKISRNALLWVMVHEFTHHLLYLTDVCEYHKSPHGESFYDLLRFVVRACGDEYSYPWHSEYRRIRTWAIRDGLCSKISH